MGSQKTCFLQALRLPTDETSSQAISGRISLAAREQSSSPSLRDIHEAALRYDCAAYLEPLDVLPTLLPCRHDGAMDLLRICALHASPKEVMIVVQEAIERMQSCLNDENEEGEGEEEIDRRLVQRTIGVVSLCSTAISRSKLGKRSAVELCSPLLENLGSLIASVSLHGTKEEGRALITEVAHLVQSLVGWASTVADVNGLREIKTLLRELLDTTVVSCASSIQASLAVRAAERCLPLFFIRSPDREWKGGEDAMHEVQLALENLGNFPPVTRTSFSDLIYLAHATPPVALSTSALSDLHHLLIGALQMNTVIDESLFLLFRMLTHENMSISPDIAISLSAVFTALASTHLDPTIRQLNLRLLSLTLTKLPPPPRIEMLLELTTHEEFPQIRGPAIGLVKEAVLEALALPSHSSGNPFASPELLRIFGSVLFRPNPPDFFSGRKTKEELAQSLELLRIADCLGFYYVLLQRDSENKTGVRSQGNVTSVQSSVLEPLRQFLDEQIGDKERPLMALSSLRVGLDRIDSALRILHLV